MLLLSCMLREAHADSSREGSHLNSIRAAALLVNAAAGP